MGMPGVGHPQLCPWPRFQPFWVHFLPLPKLGPRDQALLLLSRMRCPRGLVTPSLLSFSPSPTIPTTTT